MADDLEAGTNGEVALTPVRLFTGRLLKSDMFQSGCLGPTCPKHETKEALGKMAGTHAAGNPPEGLQIEPQPVSFSRS